MSHYYLTGWMGDGSEAAPFVPDLDAAEWTCIDLRPDASVATGWCVVWTRDPATRVPSTATYLGDGPATSLPNNLRNRVRNNLGLASLEGVTIVDIITELLTVHGGVPGRWNRLKPTRRQTAFGLVDHFEVHLGGKIREWDEAVTP